jgi:hypothetical protein
MISACSSASSMILGIARCEVLSAADRAMEVIPGTEAITSKRGAFSRETASGPTNLLGFAKSGRERQDDHRHQPDLRSTHVPYSNVTRPMPT